MQRIIKDGTYVEKVYNKETFLFRSEEEAKKLFPIMKEDERNRLIIWNGETPATIHSANLLGGGSETVFPPALEKQKELYYLAIPSQLTKYLNEVSFLDELRGLQIKSGNLKLKETARLKHLLYLSINGNAFFNKENLPNLRTIACKYREGLLDELYQYDIFDKLILQTVHNNMFEKISNVKELFGLQILRGKLDNIKNISTIKNLYWLSLDDLPRLTEVDELTELTHLEELEINYCKHIQNWDFLLQIKNLKKLTISAFSYKDYPPQNILDSLRERGISAPVKGS